MKRKDDLLKLAFGELSDDAARAVEARADAADRKEIEAFRDLRQGLQHLPLPPPDGLSAERLRAAILDRELRARPKPFAWGPALFMPAALAALAAVVLLPRLHPQEEPRLVIADDVPVESAKVPAFAPLTPVRDPSRASSSSVKPALASRPQVREEKAKPRLARRRTHRNASPVVVPERREDSLVAWNAASPPVGDDTTPSPSLMVAKQREPQTMAAPPSSVVEHTPGRGGNTETVVIVSSQRDLETGALAATEKEVSSVLVGG